MNDGNEKMRVSTPLLFLLKIFEKRRLRCQMSKRHYLWVLIGSFYAVCFLISICAPKLFLFFIVFHLFCKELFIGYLFISKFETGFKTFIFYLLFI